jgi:hypothetical protein
LPDARSAVAFGKISLFVGEKLIAVPSIEISLESENNTLPEIEAEFVLTSTQPDVTPFPKSSFAVNDPELEPARVNETGLMIPEP